MQTRRLQTLLIGFLFLLALVGTASALMIGGGTLGTSGSTTCARCTSGKTCGGGYATGGKNCVNDCEWNGSDWVNCSCYTTGDCPAKASSNWTIMY